MRNKRSQTAPVRRFPLANGLRGEIVVEDNDSTDKPATIAQDLEPREAQSTTPPQPYWQGVVLINKFIPARFQRFVSVGAIAFLSEAIVLQALVSFLGMHAFIALLIAFGVAVTIAWLLNRSYTFKVQEPHNFMEWFKYTGVSGVGGIIHLVVYGLIIFYIPVLQHYPLIPLVISSAVAVGFNYYLSATLVFDKVRRTKNKWK